MKCQIMVMSKSKYTNKKKKPVLRKNYYRIALINDDGRFHQNIHKLVLNTFENNSENKKYVDHY